MGRNRIDDQLLHFAESVVQVKVDLEFQGVLHVLAFLMEIFNDILGKISEFVKIFVVLFVQSNDVIVSDSCNIDVDHDVIDSN